MVRPRPLSPLTITILLSGLLSILLSGLGSPLEATAQTPPPGGYGPLDGGKSVGIGLSAEGGLVRSERRDGLPAVDPAGEADLPRKEPLSETERQRLFDDLAEGASVLDRLGKMVRQVSRLVKPSVIHIEAHKTENKGGQREIYDEAGSGVVIAVDGQSWVLTNRHVIAGASPREILLRTSGGREFSPAAVLSDPTTDVAVLRLDDPPGSLPPARLGDSRMVEIGDFVVAIGSPFGLAHSVTFGIISAKGRRDLSLGSRQIDLQDFFQTDAAINPGNSGGPLVNLRGEVIAINTAIASSSGGSEGIGFAIPIDMARRVAEELIRHGRLRRGYLGVTLDPDFSPSRLDLPFPDGGALVKEVRGGSPAAIAKLRRGDIIVEFAGTPIENDDHLVARVGLSPIGTPVPMVIIRDGTRYRTDVVLEIIPAGRSGR